MYMPLLILTESGDGESLNNRLRVKLSKMRTMLRRAGRAKDMREFGLKTAVIPWEDDQGFRYDALCVEQFISESHRFAMAFNRL